MNNTMHVAVVDDHVLLRNGLATLINNFASYRVVFEADNGMECIDKMKGGNAPDIVLLDINMPIMDGFETAGWLKQHYPEVRILALSMYDDDNAIIRMLRNGAKGYILKDSEARELKNALDAICQKGYYYTELVTGKLIHAVNRGATVDPFGPVGREVSLNDRELDFLRLACTELTYREIAEKMCLSPRTIDGYRDSLFNRLTVKTRVGLAMYAIKTGIVRV